jgi:hypothetical protein
MFYFLVFINRMYSYAHIAYMLILALHV